MISLEVQKPQQLQKLGVNLDPEIKMYLVRLASNKIRPAVLREQCGKFHRINMGKLGKYKVNSCGILAVTSVASYVKETWSS